MKNIEKYQLLKHPPIVVSLFQIRFNENIDLEKLVSIESRIKDYLPQRKDHIHTDINVGSITMGITSISGKSDSKIVGYDYFSEDDKKIISINEKTFSYQNMETYNGWSQFTEEIIKFLKLISDIFEANKIERLSIRFINNILIDNFVNPLEYFKTLISSTEDNFSPYDVVKYGFKIVYKIPDSNIHAIVNQTPEYTIDKKCNYIFDIDVLDNSLMSFDIAEIMNTINRLREIKNNIFFSNLTPKTIELCN